MKNIGCTMEKIWNHFEHKMLCKETNLIYDFLVGYDEDALTKALPTLGEIALQIPNPCGWGTGMEDCMLNNPLMLDAVIYRYEVTKDKKLFGLADKLLAGIRLCATVSDDRGYLARGVSPLDGKSHYINSSRDQYTQCIYALFHYYTSSMMREKDKEWITDVLVSFAERAEKNITKENEYDYLREDGQRGLVCNMWGPTLWGHEVNRIHMIYLAAWYTSRDEHWFELYKEIRDEGIRLATERIHPRTEMYGFLQMQVSMKLLYEAEPEDEYKKKYAEILKFVAQKVSDYRITEEKLDYTQINSPFSDWREKTAENVWHHFVARTERNALIGGYTYYVPQEKLWDEVIEIRNITEAVYIRMLGGDRSISEEQCSDFLKVLDFFDGEKHCSYAYICAVVSYWAAKFFDAELRV
ncbi:MAG: hypothetical protein IJN96_06525 [Clostridia bacterium]|nr:hypothetical protein [Clostridia bacterium]